MWAHGRIIADDPETVARGEESDDVVEFIRGRVTQLKEELLAESPYFVLPAGAQATVKALHERHVRVRVLTNSLASNDMLPAHSGYPRPAGGFSRTAWSSTSFAPIPTPSGQAGRFFSGRSPAALHTKAMIFDREAVFYRQLQSRPDVLP